MSQATNLAKSVPLVHKDAAPAPQFKKQVPPLIFLASGILAGGCEAVIAVSSRPA